MESYSQRFDALALTAVPSKEQEPKLTEWEQKKVDALESKTLGKVNVCNQWRRSRRIDQGPAS